MSMLLAQVDVSMLFLKSGTRHGRYIGQRGAGRVSGPVLIGGGPGNLGSCRQRLNVGCVIYHHHRKPRRLNGDGDGGGGRGYEVAVSA